VPFRNVAITAMEMATLLRMFPGRARIGVGHGVQDWMEQVGARVESPVTLLREYIEALRALLGGGSVTTEGRYVRLRDVKLGWPPAEPGPILAGGIGPRTLRRSARSPTAPSSSGGRHRPRCARPRRWSTRGAPPPAAIRCRS
jgi:alkanesulfonate monooxygenase SsuD/methylene tetrahydromethanopterin reductase-like flavin-dependent oxidoreductase (luciferase family)